MKDFAGLNAGKSCASIRIVVFLDMLRAVFGARCLTIKLPKPRRNTSSLFTAKLFLTSSINASTVALTSTLPTPVFYEIFSISSAFVISL